MDDRYDSYCAVDPVYCDSLTNTEERDGEYPIAGRPLADGWESEPVDDWLVCAPIGDDLPPQGWKVHVSACLDNAERVAGILWDYCVAHGLSFKFLRGQRMVLMRNAKYAARGGSGKFATVYRTTRPSWNWCARSCPSCSPASRARRSCPTCATGPARSICGTAASRHGSA